MVARKIIDPTAATLIRHIEAFGFTVQVRHHADRVDIIADDGRDRHTVTGPDEHIAACRLAEAVGIDLEDG